MTNEQLYLLLGSQIFNVVAILWMINRIEQSLNRRIDDLKDFIKSEIKRLEDTMKSEIKRLEDKITSSRLV